MHIDSIHKFVEKCCRMFKRSDKYFFSSKYSHMLGSILVLEPASKNILHRVSEELYDRYNNQWCNKTGVMEYIGPGIIKQYNERALSIRNKFSSYSGETSDIFSRIPNNELLFTNNRCDMCRELVCPFHEENSGFNTTKFDGKNYFCCGWCLDDIESYRDSYECGER